MQLIRPGVEMLDPIKQKPIGPAEVMEKFGVTPDKMIDVQALIGDSIDNVPGVPGIGPKGAAQLIDEFGDLETRAGRRAGDEAVQAPRHADRARRQGAHLARAGDAARRRAAAAAARCSCSARAGRQAALAAWLTTQGFRSTLTRLGLDGEAPRRRPTVEAAPRLAQAPCRCRTRRPAIAELPRASVRTRRSPPTPRCAPSWPRQRDLRLSSRSIPRPTGWIAMRAPLVGLSLATAPGRACYRAAAARGPGGAGAAGRRRSPRSARCSPIRSVLKIFQNAKFDMTGAGARRLPAAAPFDDTMLISYAQEAGAHGHGHGRTVAAASRPHADQLRRGDRHRPQPHPVSPRCRSSAPPPMPPRMPT